MKKIKTSVCRVCTNKEMATSFFTLPLGESPRSGGEGLRRNRIAKQFSQKLANVRIRSSLAWEE